MKEPKIYCTYFVISNSSCNFLNTKVNKETNIISEQHKMQINVLTKNIIYFLMQHSNEPITQCNIDAEAFYPGSSNSLGILPNTNFYFYPPNSVYVKMIRY